MCQGTQRIQRHLATFQQQRPHSSVSEINVVSPEGETLETILLGERSWMTEIEGAEGESRMIVCRSCGWLGVNEDRKWGACPACRGRKFADSVELWADTLIWAA